ncbi:MAG: hypothetical protein KJ867_01900 [Gammaproteobacteria bacterium]|nr:hypothetical protein [Gammaproteobacteria bacterium]
MSSSGHIWPNLNRKILDVALLRLRFCSIGSTKSDLNPSAILLKLFLLDALQQGAGSLLVAALAYYLMNIQLLQHLFFVFPELLLLCLAAVLLMGRYSGYRLMELRRFRQMRHVG